MKTSIALETGDSCGCPVKGLVPTGMPGKTAKIPKIEVAHGLELEKPPPK
jgi:hypothetical protein